MLAHCIAPDTEQRVVRGDPRLPRVFEVASIACLD